MKRFLPLFLVAAGVATPASSQVVNRVIGHYTPGQVGLSYSWGSWDQRYDSDGEAQDVNKTTVQRVNLGAGYDLVRMGDFNVFLAANFAMASSEVKTATSTLESGLNPQNLGVTVGFRGPIYTLRAGYHADLGNEYAVDGTTLEIPNSDNANAVQLGAEFYTPFAGLTVSGGADYYLTLKNDQKIFTGATVTDAEVDAADYLDLHLGLGYRVSDVIEVGLQSRYLREYAAKTTLGATTVQGEDGYGLTLVPYMVLSPETVPVQLTVSGATTREYAPYGLSAVGENLPVGRTGVTVGLRYGF